MAADEISYLKQGARLLALFLNIIIFYLIYVVITGNWLPTGGGESIWLINAIGLWSLTLLAAPWFRPPKDALGTAIAAALLLATIDISHVAQFQNELQMLQWGSVAFCIFIIVISASSIFLAEAGENNWKSLLLYRISDNFGKGEILFTPPTLISVLGFYQNNYGIQLFLLSLWVFFVVVKPVEVFIKTILQIKALNKLQSNFPEVGTTQRIDHPNIIRVTLTKDINWTEGKIYIACLPNDRQVYILPLFTQIQDNELVGTGLCHGIVKEHIAGAITGHIYDCTHTELCEQFVKELSGSEDESELIGFVVEGSSISNIKFEVSRSSGLEEGIVVFVNIAGVQVYYQILDAQTAEESFKQNPRGTHIAMAVQLGIYDGEKGFLKYPWLPSMNHPIFRLKGAFEQPQTVKENEFIIGEVPSTNIGLKVNLDELVEYHTAILGVTGTGKTELSLDIIKNALKRGSKVFCVDLTGEYYERLSEYKPINLGITAEQGKDLEEKLFGVETGKYGAGDEKKALQEFIEKIRSHITKQVEDFLKSDGAGLALFQLADVTNTKATLRTTELYISSIMNWAKQYRKARRIMIVLEEAHTIIPETAGSGFDYDTQWVVSRIGQIALQGRKYGVGLMIISQRTALVSKTILSQCNTYFTHSLVDQTSLNYLSSIYSHEHVKVIPNLRFLEFLAYGKAVKSERPMLVRRKWDANKYDASQKLNITIKHAEKDSKTVEDINSRPLGPISQL